MGFGGSPSIPDTPPAPKVEAPPKPAPLPSPTPTKVEAQSSAQQRRKRIASIRYGMMSTIKTSPRGITGGKVDLVSSETKKTKLGE